MRDSNGRFKAGCPGGPGRPRRRVEQDYLAALGESVSLDDWREIGRRAVTDAKAGDRHAREWLAKHLLGAQPPTLLDMAIGEAAGESIEQAIALNAAERKRDVLITRCSTPTWTDEDLEGLDDEEEEEEEDQDLLDNSDN